MPKRKRFDRSQPGARELADSIVHGAATTEGTMVAFPTCFPAVTTPVPADESRITAMDVTHDGIVYAGTSGYASHLLVGMFHGITGMVFDMGVVDGADSCAAVCCGKQKIVACVNGDRGGRLVVRPLERLPFDLIQEWHVSRVPYEYTDEVAPGEPIAHAVVDDALERVVGVTSKHLFTYDLATGVLSLAGELPGSARLVRTTSGTVMGRDVGDTLWRHTPREARLERRAVSLPKGDWSADTLMWAREDRSDTLYAVDTAGSVFAYTERDGFGGPLGHVPLAPVGAMAATTDGRLFVSAGEGIARTYCLDPSTGDVKDLGVAVSVIERRRYGYCFGDAVVGRDGEIIWGENDDMGHLWLYFPRIVP
jgi:hypothetical protein